MNIRMRSAQCEKTLATAMKEELKAHCLENAELKMERNMLKKPRPVLRNSRSEVLVYGYTSEMPV